jgi:hypothetical protein
MLSSELSRLTQVMCLFWGAECTRTRNPSNASLRLVMYRSGDCHGRMSGDAGGLCENEPMRADSRLTRALAQPNKLTPANMQETSRANDVVYRLHGRYKNLGLQQHSSLVFFQLRIVGRWVWAVSAPAGPAHPGYKGAKCPGYT